MSAPPAIPTASRVRLVTNYLSIRDARRHRQTFFARLVDYRLSKKIYTYVCNATHAACCLLLSQSTVFISAGSQSTILSAISKKYAFHNNFYIQILSDTDLRVRREVWKCFVVCHFKVTKLFPSYVLYFE